MDGHRQGDVDDCTVFFECNGSEMRRHRCIDGYGFNTKTKMCEDISSLTECNRDVHDGNKDLPIYDESKYTICQNNDTISIL